MPRHPATAHRRTRGRARAACSQRACCAPDREGGREVRPGGRDYGLKIPDGAATKHAFWCYQVEGPCSNWMDHKDEEAITAPATGPLDKARAHAWHRHRRPGPDQAADRNSVRNPVAGAACSRRPFGTRRAATVWALRPSTTNFRSGQVNVRSLAEYDVALGLDSDDGLASASCAITARGPGPYSSETSPLGAR